MEHRLIRIAHRGASLECPENTMLAFRRAIEQGVDYIETDVQLTRDGEIVIMHDETLDRTTNSSGLVRDYTFAQLQGLDAGSGEHVPALRELLELARAGHIRLCIEVKGQDAEESVEICQAVVSLVQQQDFIGRSVVTSFFPQTLRRAKMLEPHLSLLLDPSPQDGSLSPEEICEQTLAADANIISYDFHLVTPEIIREAELRGLALWPWAPNTPGEIQQLLSLGVSGIMTDCPKVLNDVLNGAAE